MATTSPARIDDDLYASAKLAGDAQSRSASQQVAHWARIGRELEASASVSHREIAQVLAGRRSYDRLDTRQQAVVRAEWAERMRTYREELDLAGRFTAEGRTWVELDDDGRVVEHGPGETPGSAPRRKGPQAAPGKARTAKTTKAKATKAQATRAQATRAQATRAQATKAQASPRRRAARSASAGS